MTFLLCTDLPVVSPVLADVPHTVDEQLPLHDQEGLVGGQCLNLMGAFYQLEHLNDKPI